MTARLTPSNVTVFLSLIMLVAAGCADDPGSQSNSETPTNQPTDNARPTPDDPPDPPDDLDANSQLLHVDFCAEEPFNCVRSTSVGVELQLPVLLLNSDDEPINGAAVGYQVSTNDGGDSVFLTEPVVYTGSDGIATARLVAGDEDNPTDAIGTYKVSVRILDDDDVNTLEFTVGVSPKNAAAYIIDFEHLGDSEPDRVRAFLLDADVSYEDATDFYLAQGHWNVPGQAEFLPRALPLVTVAIDGSINSVIYPQVENNDRFTVCAVAERNIGTQDVHVAYGCNDDAEPVEHGIDVRVTVPLVDHLPHIEERYDIDHTFDLTAALPPSVQTVIDIISTLTESPAEFLLGCPEAISACGDGTPGLVDLLFDAEIFQDSDIIETIQELRDSPTLYNMAVDFLNGLIEEHLFEGLLPSWTQDALTVAGDLTEMLQSFRIEGAMFFDEAPILTIEDGIATGYFPEGSAYQRWDKIVFRWSRGCEDAADPITCAERSFGPGDIGSGNIIRGDFVAHLHGSNYLEIEQHTLTLDYGSLLIAAVENIALPQIFDESVTSIGGMLEELISCSGLAATFTDEGSGFYNAIESMCHQLLNNATDAVYDYVESALSPLDGDDHFMIGTPEGNHCEIQQPDQYTDGWPGAPFPYIATFGQDGDARCHWDTQIDYNGDGTVNAEIPGWFDGALTP